MKETIYAYTKMIIQLIIIIVLIKFFGLFYALIIVMGITTIWMLYNWKKYKSMVETMHKILNIEGGVSGKNNSNKRNNKKSKRN